MIADVTDPAVIEPILAHVQKRGPPAPPRAPTRLSQSAGAITPTRGHWRESVLWPFNEQADNVSYPQRELLRTFMRGWLAVLGSQKVRTRDVLKSCSSDDDLRVAVGEFCGVPRIGKITTLFVTSRD